MRRFRYCAKSATHFSGEAALVDGLFALSFFVGMYPNIRDYFSRFRQPDQVDRRRVFALASAIQERHEHEAPAINSEKGDTGGG
jgi:hypothetical protein